MGSGDERLKTCKLTDSCIIYDFNLDNDYSRYSALVKDDFNIVKRFFPLLKLTILPTVKPKEIVITGNLIPYEVLKKCNSDSDINRYSIYIMATYPSNFSNNTIYVEDIYGKIDWSIIPDKHKHLRFLNGKEVLCTHHPHGEINGLPKYKRSLAILFSAWRLYIQCEEFSKTKNWALKDLRHGDEATRQLKQIGKYYSPLNRY